MSATAEFESWFDERAQCANHPHADAASTCARCGAFCCEFCLKQSWCEPCAATVLGDHLPEAARSVAWKLLLAPGILIGSMASWILRGHELPALTLAWMIPVVCAAIVLRRHASSAAWLGAVTSLALLAWQAATLLMDGAELRLIDVGLLAIAPAVALEGAARLSRIRTSLALSVAGEFDETPG